MAGVTFVAFGNGSPDLFSTFSAITNNSSSLAIGELIGAAFFITSVVIGCTALILPFRVTRLPFIRDSIFFIGAIIVVLMILWDGQIHLEECIFLIIYYVAYVGMVILGGWWRRRRRRRLEQDTHPEHTSMISSDSGTAVTEADLDRDAYGYEIHDGMELPLSRTPATEYGARDTTVRGSETSENLHSSVSVNDMIDQNTSFHHHHNHHPVSLHRGMRPSLLGAIEFRDAVSSGVYSNARFRNLFGRTYTDPHRRGDHAERSSTAPATPSPDVKPKPWASVSGAPEPYFSNGMHRSSPEGSPSLSAVDGPSSFGASAPKSSGKRSKLQVPLSIVPPSSSGDEGDQTEGSHTRMPPSPTQSRVPPPTPVTPFPSPLFSEHVVTEQLWIRIKPILFPSLTDFEEKSFFAKFTAILACPIVLILVLTLPVVEADEAENENQQPIINEPDSDCQKSRWNRWLSAVQFVFAPVFVVSVIVVTQELSRMTLLWAFAAGLVLSLLCILTSVSDHPPPYYSNLCFVGFAVGMVWVFLVASEVVALLQAIGLIIGMSDAIVGLTIFAMGNSLGDLVTNITIARMGCPKMALAACFGGPLLNILMGIGISGTYVVLKTGKPSSISMSPTLLISAAGLLTALVSTLIFLAFNDYRLTRGWACYLMILYFVCMIVNIVYEFTHMA